MNKQVSQDDIIYFVVTDRFFGIVGGDTDDDFRVLNLVGPHVDIIAKGRTRVSGWFHLDSSGIANYMSTFPRKRQSSRLKCLALFSAFRFPIFAS